MNTMEAISPAQLSAAACGLGLFVHVDIEAGDKDVVVHEKDFKVILGTAPHSLFQTVSSKSECGAFVFFASFAVEMISFLSRGVIANVKFENRPVTGVKIGNRPASPIFSGDIFPDK